MIRRLLSAGRALTIMWVALRFGLDDMLRPHSKGVLRVGLSLLAWRRFREPRAVRLRKALEALGPIFVKFGQVVSTRRDLIAPDFADELAKLQDRVPPFPYAQVESRLKEAYGKPVDAMFTQFDREPIASASVAQVHFAHIQQGEVNTPVAVKVLRPNILPVIDKDISLLRILAGWLEKLSSDGRRLRPREVVGEFDKTIHDELDLMREASNCSQLGRNFKDSPLLRVPTVHWDWCRPTVMVMERMMGVPVSDVDRMRAEGVDVGKLARDGVEIFFTQVFRDGFFHADMHPGNIQVSITPGSKGQYVGIDFGIMGTLTEVDKNYLAQNFLAFFRRDYRRVATAHIESGWVPADTRVDELEAAVRSVCEPIFGKPLKDISFGLVLMRLFQVSRRFNVEIQPQLVLLQKTLLNVEGLGRNLDPNLDLWATAQPQLERWMSEQAGWRGWAETLRSEAPQWAKLVPQLPRLLHERLSGTSPQMLLAGLSGLAANSATKPAALASAPVVKARNRWTNFWLMVIALLLFLIFVSMWLPYFFDFGGSTDGVIAKLARHVFT